MRRPIIPIPVGVPPLCDIARDFEEFIAGQVRTYPTLPIPALLGYLTTQLAIGITEHIGAQAAARFMYETLQQVQFLETIEDFTPRGDDDESN